MYPNDLLQEGAEPSQRKPEQCPSDHGQSQELRPDHIQTGAPEQDRLRQDDEMRVGCGQHDDLNDFGHGFAWRHGA